MVPFVAIQEAAENPRPWNQCRGRDFDGILSHLHVYTSYCSLVLGILTIPVKLDMESLFSLSLLEFVHLIRLMDLSDSLFHRSMHR